ncbi:MAG: WD40/YVTN/BNR-like repeat-containing protein, partial [Blastocatellia bacterium]
MKKLVQLLSIAALFCLTAGAAHAQWYVALQDQSRRDLNSIFFLDGRYGWVIGDRGIIHATQDGGQYWLAQDPRINSNLNDIFFRTRDEGYLLTSGARILKTVDGGETWELVYQLNSAAAGRNDAPELYSCSFAGKRMGWVVGTGGRILHTEDNG